MPEFKINITTTRECEVCDYVSEAEVNECRSYKTFVMCPACLNKELEAEKYLTDTETERVAKTREPIGSVAEYFNAKTQSIIARRKEIDADDSITNKNLTQTQELLEWFKQTQDNLFNIRKQEQIVSDELKAIQQTLSDLHNKLRAEEKAQLNLKDINYPYKPAEKPKAPSIKKPSKYDKVGVENAAKLAVDLKILPDAIAVSTIQTWCKAKNVTPEDALRQIAANMGREI